MLTELITRFENEVMENQNIIDSGEGCTSYARFFDACSLAWNDHMFDSDYAVHFLRSTEMHANNILKVRKYVLLNDVYGLLGLPQTEIGQIVGWIYDEKNWISFGIYTEWNIGFINGYRNQALLDFNVDGIISEKIREP